MTRGRLRAGGDLQSNRYYAQRALAQHPLQLLHRGRSVRDVIGASLRTATPRTSSGPPVNRPIVRRLAAAVVVSVDSRRISRTGARWYYCDARSVELMSRCTQSISNRQCDSMLAPTEPSIQRRGTKSQVILVVRLEEKIFLIKSYDAADKCMSFLTVQSLRQFIVGKLNFLSKLQLSSISEELVNLFSICAAIY